MPVAHIAERLSRILRMINKKKLLTLTQRNGLYYIQEENHTLQGNKRMDNDPTVYSGYEEATALEYTVQKLAQLAGISSRILRYYDEIGILRPARINSSEYRIYGRNEVDKLQQILFYRELGFSLEKINERMYGKEIRTKYGNQTIEQSYKKIKGMNEQQYSEWQQL